MSTAKITYYLTHNVDLDEEDCAECHGAEDMDCVCGGLGVRFIQCREKFGPYLSLGAAQDKRAALSRQYGFDERAEICAQQV